jgi:hypothetical protein
MKKAISSGKEGRAEIQHKGRIYVLDVYPMAEEGQAVCAYRDVTDERTMTARLVETRRWPRWVSSPAASRTRSTTPSPASSPSRS